jgi:hypothetical protein
MARICADTYVLATFYLSFTFFSSISLTLTSFLPFLLSFPLLFLYIPPSSRFHPSTFLVSSISITPPCLSPSLYFPLNQYSFFSLHSILIPLHSPLFSSPLSPPIPLLPYLLLSSLSSPPSVGWIVIGFPILVIGSKILLLLPPISWRLAGIRRGEVYGAVYACRTVRTCCKKNNRMDHATELDMKNATYHSAVEGKTMN